MVKSDAEYADNEKAYVIDNKKYVRMTHVMSAIPKPWLDRWRIIYDSENGAGSAQAYADETAGLGDLIHLVTELNDMRREKEMWELIDRERWLMPYLFAWQEFVKNYIEEVYWVERVVRVEKPWRIAGRIDRLVLYRGDSATTVLDVKSTKSLGAHMGVQLYGYRLMVIEECIRKGLPAWMWPERTVIAHLPGPRPDDDETGRVFDKVMVKEYDWRKFREPYEECVNDYFVLRDYRQEE